MLTVSKPQQRRSPRLCLHRETTWRSTHSPGEAGRSRPSLATSSATARREERLDGKFLLRTSDPTLSAEDVALGYKQLLEVERAWRDMKTTLDLRPVYHRREDRIRAHVLLCWLSLLLIRIAENATGETLADHCQGTAGLPPGRTAGLHLRGHVISTPTDS
jgi:Transposase DDE domain